MYKDRLSNVFLQWATALQMEEKCLEHRLSIVRRARASLDAFAQMAEGSANIDESSVDADASCQEVPAVCTEVEDTFGVEVADSVAPEDMADGGRFPKVEAALTRSGLTMRDRILSKAQVIAQANGGFVRPGEAGPLLRKLGLTKASERNIAGFLSKGILKSGEFERVGEVGSGLYRWLRFESETAEEAVEDCPNRGYEPEEFLVREEAMV